MVWDSTQSSLYRAVRKYNGQDGCSPDHENTEAPNRERDCFQDGSRDCSRSGSQAEPQFRSQSRAVSGKNIPITQNPDFILIAALIFILMRENADKGLILALAMMLFN